MAKKQLVSVKVNGRDREAAVEPRLLLVHFIREDLQLTPLDPIGTAPTTWIDDGR